MELFKGENMEIKYDNTYHKNYTLEHLKVQTFCFVEENNADFIKSS